MTKCDFCKFYYPSKNNGGNMACNATEYQLKCDNACKNALERFTAVSMAVASNPIEVPKPQEGDILDRLFGR